MQGYSASQFGYESWPHLQNQSQNVQSEEGDYSSLNIKKIESIEIDSPEKNVNVLAEKVGAGPIWKELMACGLNNVVLHSTQYGYYEENQTRNQAPQQVQSSFGHGYGYGYGYGQTGNNNGYQPPSNYNQQMNYSSPPQYNPSSDPYSGQQFYGNQSSYQSNYPTRYNYSNVNTNPPCNQSPKKDSNHIKTGYNLINNYHSNLNVFKKQSHEETYNNSFNIHSNSSGPQHHGYSNPHNDFTPYNGYSPTKQGPLYKSHEDCNRGPHKMKNKQSIDQFAMNNQQKKEWNDWSTIIDRIKHSISSSEKQNTMVSNQFWAHLLDKLQHYFLNKKNTIEFFHLLKDYFNIDPQHSSFDPLKFFKKFGQEFCYFQTSLFFEHKACLEYSKFVSAKKNEEPKSEEPKSQLVKFLNLTFNMTHQQTLSVAKNVFKLCEHDLDAFSFLSLYLIVSIEKGLTLQSYELVEEEFIKVIQVLNDHYPASNAQSFSSNLFDPDIKMKYEKPKIEFKATNPRDNFKDLQKFVFEKVKRSRYDEFKFRKIVQNVCLKHGYNFKLGHKIKLDNNQYAMLRTIEKILEDILPKYKQKILQAKQRIINLHKEKQSENGVLHTIVRTQIQVVSQVMGEILTTEQSVEFNIKDLLRAKCSFNSVYAIKDALTDLKTTILSYPDCQIIETKNNLSKRTRDFAVIIKLPNCIAQLQLVLNLNSLPNEFNHKIYEMRRTKLFSPVTNLYLCHNKWSQKFFRRYLSLQKHVSKAEVEPKIQEGFTFKEFRDDTKIFKKIVSHFSELNKEKLQQIKESDAKDIEKEFDQLNQVIYKSNEKTCEFTDEERAINEIQFFISANEFSKAEGYFSKMQKSEIEKNQILLELHMNLLYDTEQFGKCLQEALKLASMCTTPNDKLKVTKKIGDIYLYLPDLLEKSLDHYQVALEILAQNNQKQEAKHAKFKPKDTGKITEADILNSIGAVYLKQKVPDKSLEKLLQSQSIFKKAKKGNSMQMASTYINMGKLMEAEQKWKQAEDNYKASLEIIQKYKGKYSVEAGNVQRRLCSTYLGMGKLKNYEDSLECAKKAYDIVEHVLGKEDTETKKVLDLIEKCKAQMEVGDILENLSLQNFK